jgi:predicted nucleic acid-binding protein
VLLIDAGPLVALLNSRDQYHAWARATIVRLRPPLITTEIVLAEAAHLLADFSNGPDSLFNFCAATVQIDFRLLDHLRDLRHLMAKYRNIPMDLADATLVHLADQHRNAAIITTDSDFTIYRTKSRRQLKLIAPFNL